MFEHMEYVYAVYKQRSFSKAADKLYITQPSLSATVKKVEIRLGTQLFDRSCNPIRLTDSGVEYIKCAEKVMDIQQGFESYVNGIAGLQVGSISIGASNFFASYIMPSIITRYKEQHPRIHINLLEADTTTLEQRLSAGDVDMIIDNFNFNEVIYKKHFFSTEVLLLAIPESFANSKMEKYRLTASDIAANRHLSAETPAAPLALFKKVPFIVLRYGNDTRSRGENIFAEQGFTPKLTLELDQLATAYQVACNGMGATLISDTLVKVSLPDPRVFYCKIDSVHTSRNNYFYYKHSKYISNAMEKFLEIAVEK